MARTLRIVKRDRRRERFSQAKLMRAIQRAAREAKVTAQKRAVLARDVTRDVLDSLRRRSSVAAVDLRKRVLGRLDRRARSVASAWRRYDRIKR